MNTTQTPPKTTILEPPSEFFSSLKFLGPGFILSAAIVGSGELIATTILGAKTGFVLLWVIVISCLMKVAVQLEYGRFCITHGKSTFQGWNTNTGAPGLRLHWSLWCAFLFLLSLFIGQAGVLGGSAQVATYIFPSLSVEAWTALLALLLFLLVFHGKYGPVELIAAGLNFIFVFSVLYCLFSVLGTKYAFSLSNLADGFTFRLPRESVVYALGVFGITGVAGGEIISYPYWCLEKGYAAWTGPNDGSPEWGRRARGWIRVMTLDALASMALYTVVTCAFYILGASVLRPQGKIADGNGLVLQLSNIFTEVLGEKARFIYMIGAFAVLFSTVFANTAAFSRLWTDFFGICGWIDRDSRKSRSISLAVMSFLLPATWALVYLAYQQPLFLVIFMGICNSLFLLVVVYQAIVFRFRFTDPQLKPSWGYVAAFWVSILSIAFVAWQSGFEIIKGK